MDLIERQAAIDAILAIKDYGNSDRANALGLAECAITTLPSAQPEIIRCKDCRYTDEDGVCQSSKGLAIQDDDDFCSKAERREE